MLGDQGGRDAVHTPVNASWVLAPRVAGGGVVAEVAAVEGGEGGQEWGCRRCPEQHGLQDESFGVMSDACDSSFLSATAGEVADMLGEDRRASMGGAGSDRRASMGSVLGAVFEEMPAVEDTMPFECASCPEGGSRAGGRRADDRASIGLKTMPGSGDGGEWGKAQPLGEGEFEVAAAGEGAEDSGRMWL